MLYNEKQVRHDRIKRGICLSSGWTTAVLFGVSLVGGLKNPKLGFTAATYIFVLAVIAVGVLLIRYSVKIKRRIKLYEMYFNRFSADDSHSLMLCAEMENKTLDQVKLEVGRLIARGYFGKASIDAKTNTLILQCARESEHPAIQTAFTCPYCGAPNRVKRGDVSECEYCGSQISGKE